MALRSVLRKNDFEKVQQPGKDKVLFCPRLDTSSKQSGDSHWCMALCGVEEKGPQTVDQFAVYSLGPDGTPVEKPNCRVKMEGPDGPLKVKVESVEDGTFKAEYNPDI
eukprot:TRINITY_DN66_c0_g2_i6.p1 TRINITY_DN66_c0_g2~~TRINITY_DN66_c0_g2_i6.p1  ORF type:complete len:108 (+),score=39.47 TRINITY_DN66_c0_g2_i6:285-608(+)